MLRSEVNVGSDVFDRDVHAIAASLNDTGATETGVGVVPGRSEVPEHVSPVILQRRASRGLESRLNDEQRPRLMDGEDGRRVIEQRLDRLDARLESVSRSVEFSEAFLNLKLKQQLQEVIGASAAAQVGGKTRASRGGWRMALLLICVTGPAALLAAEVHSDAASRTAAWAVERVAPLVTLAAQSWPG